MPPCRTSGFGRLRSLAAPVAAGMLSLGVAACGSDSGSDASPSRRPRTAATAPSSSEVATTAVPTTPVPTTAEPTTTEAPSPECNGLSAADVGAAAGAEFDTAEDTSAGADVSCLFSQFTTADSVVVLTESTATYLGGALNGLPVEEALGVLETTYTGVIDAPTVEQTTIGGFPGIVVTGTNSIRGMPTGYASTIVDGVVVEVSSTARACPRRPTASRRSPPPSPELAVAAQA